MAYANISACQRQPNKSVEMRRLVYKGGLCISAPTGRRAYLCVNFAVGVSMSSLFEPGKEALRHERAMSTLCDRTGAPPGEVRSLLRKNFRGSNWMPKFARTWRSWRRPTCAQCCAGSARSPRKTAMHDHAAPIRSKRLADELKRVRNKPTAAVTHRRTTRRPTPR